ncbi:unnamed protein product, partial [Candidula unifasciata]
SVCASRMSMSRRHSVIFTGLDARRASQAPSMFDTSSADSGQSQSSKSPGSSLHADGKQETIERTFTRKTSQDLYTYTDEEVDNKDTSNPASDPVPPDSINANDPASEPLPPDNINVNDPASDPTPAGYTDQEGSQRDTGHVATDHQETPSCVLDCSHREHDVECDISAPPGVRRVTSGTNKRVVTLNALGNEKRYSKDTAAPTSSSEIVQGVYLHIMADALGSIGVIVSSTLINWFGWVIADPICSMFISALVILSVIPLLQESMGILMQRTPVALDEVLPRCYDRVSSLDGVCSIQQPHFWTLCSDVYVGALKLEVEPDADSQDILHRTRLIFYEVGVKHLYVQIEEAALSI